jgi:AcrR family transcriptional regulator
MAPSRKIGAVRLSDLSTYARIRNAALEGFASAGVASTSIRDVAAAAGVSPGLVQHHFATKAGLRDAVNEYVIAVSSEALRDLFADGQSGQAWASVGDTVTEWVRDNAVALRYVARAIVEGDEAAAGMFDALIEIARTNGVEPLVRNGELRADVDRDWAAIHFVVFNLASVLLEPAIDRHLPEPFFTLAQLKRWNAATTDLYRRGLSSSASTTPESSTGYRG